MIGRAIKALGSRLSLSWALVLTTPAMASAQIVGDLPSKNPRDIKLSDVELVLSNIIQYLLAFAGAVAAVFMVVNAYQYVLASGNPEKLEKAKMGLTWSIAGLLLAGSAYAIVHLLEGALGAKQQVPLFPTGGAESVSTVLENIIMALLIFAGAIALIYLIIGAYRYVTSSGNPEMIEQAKKTIIYSVIGLIVAIIAYVIFLTVQDAVTPGSASPAGGGGSGVERPDASINKPDTNKP